MMLLDLLSPKRWARVNPRWLPFADLVSQDLSLLRLLRLSLFQVSVGLCMALMVGTLNRVLIVEMGVAAWLVASMVALPVLVAPLRAMVGYRSDTHRSFLGLRRLPYLWVGSLLTFGGLAIMPFALLLLSGDTHWPKAIGPASAALAFLLVGLGIQTVQTTGLALATDLVDKPSRPRMVALMYAMLLVGMVGSGLLFSLLLQDFSPLRLIQVVQGAASLVLAMNLLAMWKQEPRRAILARAADAPNFGAAWRQFVATPGHRRFLVAVFMGTAAFSMQDIILEPYGAEVLGLSVAQTTFLTVLLASGALVAFWMSAIALRKGYTAHLMAAVGALVGTVAFSLVIFSEPVGSPLLFQVGTTLIGFGGGFFSIGTLSAAMSMDSGDRTGLALGAWGAVQATSLGLAIGLGGAIRDLVSAMAVHGDLGAVLTSAGAGYSAVYHLELLLLFMTLVALGPLVKVFKRSSADEAFGLAEFPG
jgi:BCD family chlorophyll transporter-like MFS transporter